MKFLKKLLQDTVYEDADETEVILDEVIDNSRWSINHKMVFKYKDKFYMSFYSVGATEQQCECAYEYSSAEIDCDEVEQKEVTVKQWVIIGE